MHVNLISCHMVWCVRTGHVLLERGGEGVRDLGEEWSHSDDGVRVCVCVCVCCYALLHCRCITLSWWLWHSVIIILLHCAIVLLYWSCYKAPWSASLLLMFVSSFHVIRMLTFVLIFMYVIDLYILVGLFWGSVNTCLVPSVHLSTYQSIPLYLPFIF